MKKTKLTTDNFWANMLMLFLVLAALVTTCSCSNPLIPEEPIEDTIVDSIQSFNPNDTIQLVPIEKAGMKLCSCEGGVSGGNWIGVICTNGQFLTMGQHLGNACICGSYSIKYWVCKRKKEES